MGFGHTPYARFNDMEKEKLYRFQTETELPSFQIREEESDLWIACEKRAEKKSRRILHALREDIKKYIEKNPEFLTSLSPVPFNQKAPEIIKEMIKCSEIALTGPMAGVAGAVAEFLGREILADSREVIVENGGDIFMKIETPRTIGIYAPGFPPMGLKIVPEMTPLGVCSSSGKHGHSLSFGCADLITVLASSATLADCLATAAGNRIQSENDMDDALERLRTVRGVSGAVIIAGKKSAFFGNLDFVNL